MRLSYPALATGGSLSFSSLPGRTPSSFSFLAFSRSLRTSRDRPVRNRSPGARKLLTSTAEGFPNSCTENDMHRSSWCGVVICIALLGLAGCTGGATWGMACTRPDRFHQHRAGERRRPPHHGQGRQRGRQKRGRSQRGAAGANRAGGRGGHLPRGQQSALLPEHLPRLHHL